MVTAEPSDHVILSAAKDLMAIASASSVEVAWDPSLRSG
jgi:hypothetical protein